MPDLAPKVANPRTHCAMQEFFDTMEEEFHDAIEAKLVQLEEEDEELFVDAQSWSMNATGSEEGG